MAEAVSLSGSVSAQMKEAMKAGDKTRVGALRLIMSALKDREIEARGAGKIVSRADELTLLTKMTKTRQESLTIYKDNGREDLAAQESAEIAIINEFLPKQMDEAAVAHMAVPSSELSTMEGSPVRSRWKRAAEIPPAIVRPPMTSPKAGPGCWIG